MSSEDTAVTKGAEHDRCLSCLLVYAAELAERRFSLDFVNPTLEVMQTDGKVC